MMIANLRSAGLCEGLLIEVRRDREQAERDARDRDARDHRLEHLQELLQSEEVPRGLRRVRRAVHVGLTQQRRFHQRREDRDERRERQDRRELDREQVRPHVHLVLRFGARLLDRSRLDDRQQSLGVPAGTRARGRRCGDRGRGGSSRASGSPPRPRAASPPAIAALRLRDRSSRCAGTPPVSSVICSPAASAAAAADAPRPRARPRRAQPRLRGAAASAFLALDGKTERLAALLTALQEMFGDFGHRLAPPLPSA